MASTNSVPTLAEALRDFLQRVPVEQQQLLIALSERMAAERYRGWAVLAPAHRAALLACAEREDEVARRVEALHHGAAATQAEISARNPDLAQLTRSFFAPYSLAKQLRLQAEAERLGAATWRSLAKRQSDAAVRDVFLGCALLEEESAVVLEAMALLPTRLCGDAP
jgi:hypothetical protein